MAGIAGGIGHAFQQIRRPSPSRPLAHQRVEPGKQFEAGLGTGVGRALDRLAQYYITLAEKIFPVIEVDAGRTVDVVITSGVSLQDHSMRHPRTARTFRSLQTAHDNSGETTRTISSLRSALCVCLWARHSPSLLGPDEYADGEIRCRSIAEPIRPRASGR